MKKSSGSDVLSLATIEKSYINLLNAIQSGWYEQVIAHQLCSELLTGDDGCIQQDQTHQSLDVFLQGQIQHFLADKSTDDALLR